MHNKYQECSDDIGKAFLEEQRGKVWGYYNVWAQRRPTHNMGSLTVEEGLPGHCWRCIIKLVLKGLKEAGARNF